MGLGSKTIKKDRYVMSFSLVERALCEDKWIYSPIIDEWYSPYEMRERLVRGHFQTSLYEWQLRSFDELLITLRQNKVQADLELEKAIDRYKQFRQQRREQCLGI